MKIRVRVYPPEAEGSIVLEDKDVFRYEVTDALPGRGLPLGAAASRRFTLLFDRARAEGVSFEGARVTARLFDERIPGAREEDESTWQDFGVWYADGLRLDENGCLAALSGADALSSLFSAGFTDSPSAYPRTLLSLCQSVCGAAAGAPLNSGDFYNAGLRIARMPEWTEGITLRQVLGQIACAAGGLVRIDWSGMARIVPCRGGQTFEAGPEIYERFVLEGGRFCFNAILHRPLGQKQYVRYARDAALSDSAENALWLDGGFLLSGSVLQGLSAELAGSEYVSGRLVWRPAGLPQAGDSVVVRDGEGRVHQLLITGQSLCFDAGGLRCSARSMMPRALAPAGANGANGIFAPDGSVRFEAIGEVTEKVLALAGAYVGSLTAGDINATGLTARIVEAMRLQAMSVRADDVTTDNLTAMAAEVVLATVRKLRAGTVQTDELAAALIETFAIRVGSLTAQDIYTDRLAAALSRFSVLTAGEAQFDRATVSHLLASALTLSYGAAGEVFIENLTADYAALVRADVGRLCVRASDGAYYELNVDASTGQVSACPRPVSDAEAQDGRTLDGRTILETCIAASDLSASSVKAVRALVDRLDASRIDADALFASSAFINRLNAQDITSNSYIRLALTDLEERARAGQEAAQGALALAQQAEPMLENLSRWLTFDEDGLKQGKVGSVFSTQVDESGFHILRRGAVKPVGSFTRDGLDTGGLRLGGIAARPTVRGGWVWEETEE